MNIKRRPSTRVNTVRVGNWQRRDPGVARSRVATGCTAARPHVGGVGHRARPRAAPSGGVRIYLRTRARPQRPAASVARLGAPNIPPLGGRISPGNLRDFDPPHGGRAKRGRRAPVYSPPISPPSPVSSGPSTRVKDPARRTRLREGLLLPFPCTETGDEAAPAPRWVAGLVHVQRSPIGPTVRTNRE